MPKPTPTASEDRPGLTADALARLEAEADALFARMQTPEHRAAVDRALAASGAELGAAAVVAARAARSPTTRK